MTDATPLRTRSGAVGTGRAAVGIVVVVVLTDTFAERIAVGDSNPFDYFGYFTNQTGLFASIVLIATGIFMVAGRRVPDWLTAVRGVATASLLVVAVVYNLLVPGTGSAPLWVNIVLHIVFPLAVTLDWLLIGDRPILPWNKLWIVLPYPLLWLTVVLIRGATDGWVPYGFLLPERGFPSVIIHIIGLLASLLAAGSLVWATSRTTGICLRATTQPP